MLTSAPTMRRQLKATTFGGRVKELRASVGWSQKELADRSGVPGIAMIERRPGAPLYENALKLAEVFGIPVDDLYGTSTTEAPRALEEFLDTPAARGITPDEIDQLRRLPTYGKTPNEETYYWALKMLRSMAKDQKT